MLKEVLYGAERNRAQQGSTGQSEIERCREVRAERYRAAGKYGAEGNRALQGSTGQREIEGCRMLKGVLYGAEGHSAQQGSTGLKAIDS
jgi:hypothetical protein